MRRQNCAWGVRRVRMSADSGDSHAGSFPREQGGFMERTLVQARRETVARADAPAARVICEAIEFETTTRPRVHRHYGRRPQVVDASGVQFGQVTIFSQHTTAAIKINENEPLLLRDLARTLRQFAPPNAYYEHNDFSRRTVNMNEDECANGHSHVQHLFLGTSETIPIIDGRISLGTLAARVPHRAGPPAAAPRARERRRYRLRPFAVNADPRYDAASAEGQRIGGRHDDTRRQDRVHHGRRHRHRTRLRPRYRRCGRIS